MSTPDQTKKEVLEGLEKVVNDLEQLKTKNAQLLEKIGEKHV